MAGITNARVQLAEQLQEAGLRVSNHVPAKVVPPLVLLSTAEPMLDNEVNTFNGVEYDFHLTLYVVGGTAATEEALKALEVQTEKVLVNLGDWTVDSVGAPTMRPSNDNVFLSVAIDVHNTITIGEDS